MANAVQPLAGPPCSEQDQLSPQPSTGVSLRLLAMGLPLGEAMQGRKEIPILALEWPVTMAEKLCQLVLLSS